MLTDGTFTQAGVLNQARTDAAAAPLSDGRVLIAGGSLLGADGNSSPVASVEIFDPTTGAATAAAGLSVARAGASATALLDGRVAVIGGNDGSNDLASAEIYDPTSGNWSTAVSGATARSHHIAVLLPNNNSVLVTGGSAGAASDLFIPWTNSNAGSFVSTSASGASHKDGFALGMSVEGLLFAGAGDTGTGAELYRFATVKTDQPDYAPGTIVNISGSGWQPGETVTLTLVESPLIDTHPVMTAVADAFGNISNNQFSPDIHDLDIRFYLTATGSQSQAQNTFTDAPQKPTSTITFPADAAFYRTSAWTAGAPIAGSATFAAGTTGRVVNVSIKRNSTGKFWNGTSFNNTTETGTSLRLAALSGSAWTLSFPASNFPADDSYTVHSQAVDSNGTENGTTVSTFTLDNVASAPPSAPSLAAGSDSGSSQSDEITNVTTNLNFSGTAEPKSTVNLFVDGSSTSAGSGTTGNGGNWNNITVAGTLSEGTHSISAKATDQAGNVSTLSAPLTITIDTTAPTMGLGPASGNVSAPFSFNWSITDPTSSGVSSGVNTATCKVTIDAVQVATTCSGSHSVATGTHTVVVLATDIAGNQGSDTRTYNVISDSTPPKVTVAFPAPDGQNGWFVHSPVSGTVTANDTTTGNSNVTAISCLLDGSPLTVGSLSGFGTPSASGSISVSGEGSHNVSCTATDSASNTGASAGSTAMPVVVKIDTVAPTLTPTRVTAANANGWNNTDVAMQFSCTDATSGVGSITAAGSATGSSTTSPLNVSVATEGSNQSVDGAYTDAAGNSATPASISGVKIDKTPPTLTFGAASPAANANGWNNTNVSIPFTPADSLSGVDITNPATSPLVLTTEGSAVTGTVTVTDMAGNTATFTSPALKIDKTPPTISGSRAPAANANGWNNINVTASFTCSDSLSGLAVGNPPADTVVSTEGANQSVTGTCMDVAGNSASYTVSNISIDKTAPTATATPSPAANPNGWNNSNVTVSFTGNDSLSGIDFCTTAAVLSSEGAGQSSSTVSVAVLLLAPVPPWVELTAPVVLDLVPAVVPVTFTLMLQEPLAASAPLPRLIEVLPAVAPVTVPPQVLLRLGVAATCSPAGKVSLTPTPVKPVSVELMAPVVLDLIPAVVPVTFTPMEHEALDASVPPVKPMLLEPAVADNVPRHVLLAPFGVATTKPAGSASLKATPVRARPALGLLILNVTLVVPLSGMLAAPKALLMVGGLATLSVAVLLVAPVPPLVELTLPVVLFLVPAVVAVTFTLTAHALLAVTVPPLRLIEVLAAVAPVTVPPQVLLRLGVAATCSPAGKLSVTATPLEAVPVLGLVMVNVKLVVPLTGTLVAPKALLMVGGATTVRVAVLLVAPVPPSVEVIAPVVLFLPPAVVPVTSTLMAHELLAATVPPLRPMLLLPAVAVSVPLHVLLAPFGVATTSPETRVSEKATPVSGVPLGLVMVNVTLVEPLSGTLAAPNALLMVGGPTTVRLAVLLVAPAPLSVELMAPVVLDLVPAVVPVTSTPMEQDPLDASVPLDKLMLLEPTVADNVPLHVLLAPFGVATTKPAGRLSVKATPVSPKPEFGLLMLNVKLVVPLSVMLATPNALLMVGGLATVSVAVLLVVPVPPLVEVMAPVVLLTTPLTAPVTLREIVHELLTGIEPPLRESGVLPEVAPLKVPPQ